jgi:hypothetical protein
MKLAGLLLENILQEGLYGDQSMPFLWQVIYHEAMRGNHMLFEGSDLGLFDQDRSHEAIANAEPDCTSEFVYNLFACNDLATIQRRIRELPFRQKRRVHRVYLRFLERWRLQIKQSLN